MITLLVLLSLNTPLLRYSKEREKSLQMHLKARDQNEFNVSVTVKTGALGPPPP